MLNMMHKPFYTAKQVCDLLKVRPGTLSIWARDGVAIAGRCGPRVKLRVAKVGGRVTIFKADLDRFLKKLNPKFNAR